LLVGFTLAVTGCSSGPDAAVYNLPVQEVYERLLEADMTGFRTARQCGILIHFEQQIVTNREVGWRVTSSGREMLWFKIKLIPDGPNRTRTEVEVSPDPKGGEKYDGDYFYIHPAIHQPLRPAVKELVDAAIERRAYDVWKIPEPINTNDDVCSVQRGAIEGMGTPFHVDDQPGDGPGESQRRKSSPASSFSESSSSGSSGSDTSRPADAGWGDGSSD
jgi:hypothetical protein